MGGGRILPIGQEIACHFSQDHTMVTKLYNVCVAQKLQISEFLIESFCLDPGLFGDLPRPISTSATSIGYQILAKDLSFHMKYCLLLQNEIGRSYTMLRS